MTSEAPSLFMGSTSTARQWQLLDSISVREKVMSSLNTTCPKCGFTITPDLWVDFEQIECPECGEIFQLRWQGVHNYDGTEHLRKFVAAFFLPQIFILNFEAG